MNEEEVNRRIHIIKFEQEFGSKATEAAFKISSRTLRRWRERLRIGEGKLDKLSPISCRPKRMRQSSVSLEIRNEILKLRQEHIKLGKEKIFHILKRKYLKTTPSIATIGRVIWNLKKRGLLPINEKLTLRARSGNLYPKHQRKTTKLRKQKGEEVFQVDTVIRHFNQPKLYTLTGIDTKTRTAFAKCYLTHKSEKTKDFIEECIAKFPINKIQTDNGSEFAAHFKSSLKENQIVHYHSYPRCPKMNAYVERFNRTLDEEFLKMNKFTAIYDLGKLNQELEKYLSWYNNERPHEGLNFLSPKEYMISLEGSGQRCLS